MDIDMDIDLGPEPEIPNAESEPMNIEPKLNFASSPALPDTQASSPDIAPGKVHIRGLDNLTTSEIRDFASEHFSSARPIRIEWIDDTSANIVYQTSSEANEALLSFTNSFAIEADQIAALELRRAKKLSTHPNIDLFVRHATTTDIKKPRAREASRFYLMNPDKDPRERKGMYDNRRPHRRDDRKRTSSRRSEEPESVTFDINMYDDEEPASVGRRAPARRTRQRSQASLSSEDGSRRVRIRSPNRGHNEEDLIRGRISRTSDGRLRGRSTSPVRTRDGDGTLGFDESGMNIHRLQKQSPSPPPQPPRERRGAISYQNNAGKELIGSAINGRSNSQLSSSSEKPTDLFPSKGSSSNPGRELFRRTGSPAIHRRTGAFDAADGTADLFANRLSDNSMDTRDQKSLADRISGGPGLMRSGTSDSLAVEVSDNEGFSIRGTAQKNESPGFSIRGASGAGQSVKELIPTKVGTDLFARKIQGRGGPRRRAEDMYF